MVERRKATSLPIFEQFPCPYKRGMLRGSLDPLPIHHQNAPDWDSVTHLLMGHLITFWVPRHEVAEVLK